MESLVPLPLDRCDTTDRAITGGADLSVSSFSCACRQPGLVCLAGSESAPVSLDGRERRCAVGHRMVPAGPVDDLSVWRQAWHAAYPFAIGGVR